MSRPLRIKQAAPFWQKFVGQAATGDPVVDVGAVDKVPKVIFVVSVEKPVAVVAAVDKGPKVD